MKNSIKDNIKDIQVHFMGIVIYHVYQVKFKLVICYTLYCIFHISVIYYS